MSYQVFVYYHGPQSAWAGKPAESEITFKASSPWLWMARYLARAYRGNTGRCGYVITSGIAVVEQVEATVPAVAGLPS